MWPFKKKTPKYTFSAKEALSVISKSGFAITYDDILLAPQFSDVESRKDVNTRTPLYIGQNPVTINIPILSANMDTVTWVDMAAEMNRLGGAGILHRYESSENIIKAIKGMQPEVGWRIPSVGVGVNSIQNALDYTTAGASMICVDIAHGHSKKMLEIVADLAFRGINVIAGNIATYEGALALAEAGAKCLKIGIGPGAMCSTRRVTGHGMPQVTAILDCARVKEKFPNVTLIADGGIRDSGDVAKAIALGADMVMIGSLLAGTTESPGTILGGRKVYRGMASREAREDFDPNLPTDYTPEGVSMMKPLTGPAKQVIDGLVGGLRSAMSYSGAHNLQEYREKAKFMFITNASHVEGTPHGLLGNK